MPGPYPEIQIGANIREVSVNQKAFSSIYFDIERQLGKALGSAFDKAAQANTSFARIEKQFDNIAGYSQLIARFLSSNNSEVLRKNIDAVALAYGKVAEINRQLASGKLSFSEALQEARRLRSILEGEGGGGDLGKEFIRRFEKDVVTGFAKTAERSADAFAKGIAGNKDKIRQAVEDSLREIDTALSQRNVDPGRRAALEKRRGRAQASLASIDTSTASPAQLAAQLKEREKALELLRTENKEAREYEKWRQQEYANAKKRYDAKTRQINKLIEANDRYRKSVTITSAEEKKGGRGGPTAFQQRNIDTLIGPIEARANRDKLAQDYRKLFENVEKGARKATVQNRRLNKSIERSSFTVEQFGNKAALAFQRYGAFVVGSFGIFRLVGFIRSATDEALKFEAIMTKLEQVLVKTRQEVKPLADDLRRLAKETGISTDEIGQGVFLFAQSGVKDLNQLRILAEQLAKVPLSATFGDIQQTSEGLLAVFGQFNKEVDETSRVLDLVNKFAADFAIESQDIFEIIRRGGATVAAAKVSFEDFLGLSSLIRESTRESASTIGTFFKTGIARLLQPSSQKALRALGVDANTVFGQLQQLSNVFADKNPFEQIQLAQSLVGVRQISRLIALLRELQDPQARARIEETLSGATGSFDEQTAKRLDDIGTSVNRIQKSFQDLIINVTENTALKNLVATIADLSQQLSSLGTVLNLVTPAALGFFAILAKNPLQKFGRGFIGRFTGGRRGGRQGPGPLPFIPGEITNNDQALRLQRLDRVRRGRSLQRLGSRSLVGGLLAGSVISQEGGKVGATAEAATEGLGIGLLVGAINPLVGGFAALATFTNRLVTSFKELNQAERDRLFEIGSQGNLNTFAQSIKEIIRDTSNEERKLFGLDLGVKASSDFQTISTAIEGREKLGFQFAAFTERIFRDVVADIGTQQFASEEDRNKALNDALRDELSYAFNALGLDINSTPGDDQVGFIIEIIRKYLNGLQEPEFLKPLAGSDILQAFKNVDALGIAIGKAALILRDFTDSVSRYDDQINTVITSVADLQTVKLPSNQEDLLNRFGLGNITNIANNNKLLDQIAIDFTRQFSESFRDINLFEGSSLEAQKAIQFDLEGFFRSLLGINTVDAVTGKNIDISSKDQSRLDAVTDQFGDFLNIIAAQTGKTLPEISEEIIEAVNNGESLTKIFGGFNGIADKTEALIRKVIETENRRLQVQFQLNQNIVAIDTNIRKFNQSLFELGDAVDDVDTRIDTLVNRTDSITSARNRGQTLLDRSRRTQFTQPLQDFINDVRSTAARRIRDLETTQGINRGTGPIDFKDFEESLQSQTDFLDLQAKVNDRLSELEGRIRNASEAASEFIRAFEESNNQLRSTGAALSSLNADQITEGLAAFDKFTAAAGLTAQDVGRASGIQKSGRGLETLNRREFDSLSQILNTAGGFNLGGGLTGADILGEAQRSIALPFLAELRSRFTGETSGEAQKSILDEISKAEEAAKQALEEEKRLREQQIRLVELQRELAQQERQFYVDQKASLDQIVKNTNITNELKTIASKVNQLFGSTAQPVSLVQGNGGLTPAGTQGGSVATTGDITAITNSIDQQTTVMKDCVCETLQSINDNIIGIADQLNRMLSGELTTTLEISPIQVNVSITAPDIVKTIGPVLKQTIVSEIGAKLSEIFQDDPQKSSELKGL